MDRSDKIRECSLDGDYFEMYPVDEFEDQVEELVDLELVFPLREYTMSKNNIYFTTSSDPRRVWLLNELDGDYTYSILAYGDEESKRLFDIPIVSLSASLNDDRILLVSYNENQSEIIMLDKDDENLSTREIKKYKKTNIKKPDSDQMNYLYGILDPQNSNRYLLIARSQTSKTSENKNLAKVFVMNSDSPNGREGEFTMYRSMELLLVYNNPEIQFHPLTGDIYFIDDVKHNKKLAYWDGEKTNLASLNLDNIMNFKFSPDGKYLLATTFDPNDLYLYEVTE